MKAQTFILTILITLFSFSILPGKSESNFKKAGQSQGKQIQLSIADQYTYVRVFKNGIWWIYVYDGEILIDIYPE